VSVFVQRSLVSALGGAGASLTASHLLSQRTWSIIIIIIIITIITLHHYPTYLASLGLTTSCNASLLFFFHHFNYYQGSMDFTSSRAMDEYGNSWLTNLALYKVREKRPLIMTSCR
jgi:hypothetical protein